MELRFDGPCDGQSSQSSSELFKSSTMSSHRRPYRGIGRHRLSIILVLSSIITLHHVIVLLSLAQSLPNSHHYSSHNNNNNSTLAIGDISSGQILVSSATSDSLAHQWMSPRSLASGTSMDGASTSSPSVQADDWVQGTAIVSSTPMTPVSVAKSIRISTSTTSSSSSPRSGHDQQQHTNAAAAVPLPAGRLKRPQLGSSSPFSANYHGSHNSRFNTTTQQQRNKFGRVPLPPTSSQSNLTPESTGPTSADLAKARSGRMSLSARLKANRFNRVKSQPTGQSVADSDNSNSSPQLIADGRQPNDDTPKSSSLFSSRQSPNESAPIRDERSPSEGQQLVSRMGDSFAQGHLLTSSGSSINSGDLTSVASSRDNLSSGQINVGFNTDQLVHDFLGSNPESMLVEHGPSSEAPLNNPSMEGNPSSVSPMELDIGAADSSSSPRPIDRDGLEVSGPAERQVSAPTVQDLDGVTVATSSSEMHAHHQAVATPSHNNKYTSSKSSIHSADKQPKQQQVSSISISTSTSSASTPATTAGGSSLSKSAQQQLLDKAKFKLATTLGLAPSFAEITVTPNQQQQQQSNSSPLTAGAAQSEAIQSSATPTPPLQTITKTYSTVITSVKTRLVPLAHDSTTAVHTITEQFLITKMITSMQTMPAGQFVLPEHLVSRSPFEMLEDNEALVGSADHKQSSTSKAASGSLVEQPIVAPNYIVSGNEHNNNEHNIGQEQPITMSDNNSIGSSKNPNDWLHDFQANNQLAAFNAAADPQSALFSTGANDATSFELDQLASTMDPTGAIASLPDLNNPVVLAAALQNPQLGAVILAAQRLQLQRKQQQQLALQQQQQHPNLLAIAQPSFSTTLTTVTRPTTYVVRDTVYTTRLVSFKDGRTVKTRTISEPASVSEQTLTTMATEVTPITLTIRPTVSFQTPALPPLATAQPDLNGAFLATQLAAVLARRQQQQQQQGTINSLQQQLAASRQREQQQLGQRQPQLQQLLQALQGPTTPVTPSSSVQQQQSQQQQQQQPPQRTNSNSNSNNSPPNPKTPSGQAQVSAPVNPTPALPITTILTNLQVKTYTVHNAFKTIYRTITSTMLTTSTILPDKAASAAVMAG